MKNKVTIIDDTFRVNRCTTITKGMNDTAIEATGNPLGPVGSLIPLKYKGQQVQDVVKVPVTFEGRHLEIAIRRAKRFLRSVKRKPRGAPRHIALALAAFQKADPEGFKNAVTT